MMNSKKLRLTIAIVLSVFILTFAGFQLRGLHQNHQANMQKIEECFEGFDKGVLTVTISGANQPLICENE